MGKDKTPVTPAVRELRRLKIDFTPCPYAYEDKGGTTVAARELGVDEHQVIKTLVLADDQNQPFLMLQHGDREVSLKELARLLDKRKVVPCDATSAQRHTGYQVGGISPFGTKKALPVYVEKSILELPQLFINAGKRGLLARLTPADLVKALKPTPVQVAR